DDGRTPGDGLLDESLDEFVLRLRRRGSHRRLGVPWRAGTVRLSDRLELGEQRLRDGLVDVEALDRRADLSGQGEGTAVDARGDLLDVDVGEDHGRVVAAELELEPAE